MHLVGWTLIAIGVVIAFGLPSLTVMKPGPFSFWEIIWPIVGGALLILAGRVVQGFGKAPQRQRGKL